MITYGLFKDNTASIQTVSIDTKIECLTEQNVCQNPVKLSGYLKRAIDKLETKEEDAKQVAGITDFGIGRITYFEDTKFICRLWATGKMIGGTWYK